EYYSFRAFFEPYHVRTDRVPGEPDPNKAGIPRAYDAYLDAPTHLFERGNEARPDKSKSLPAGVPAVLGGSSLKIEPLSLPLTAYIPDKRAFVIEETLSASAASVPKARESLALARRLASARASPSVVSNPLEVLALVVRMQQAGQGISMAELDVQVAETKHEALTAAIKAEQLED